MADLDKPRKTDRLAVLESKISSLSKQVKIYGAIVTIAAVAVPAYGQIRSAYAAEQIRKVAREEIVLALQQLVRITPPR